MRSTTNDDDPEGEEVTKADQLFHMMKKSTIRKEVSQKAYDAEINEKSCDDLGEEVELSEEVDEEVETREKE